MSNVKSSYERVKTTLSDILYREKGYVTVVSEKIDELDESDKTKVVDLVQKQNAAVNALFVKVDELDTAMTELFELGEDIYSITAGTLVNTDEKSESKADEVVLVPSITSNVADEAK